MNIGVQTMDFGRQRLFIIIIIIIVLIIIIITNLVSPCYYPAIYLLPFRFLFLYGMVKYE